LGELAEDVKLWNSPAIGAYLFWRFTTGYCEAHASGDAPVGLLHFIAAAILTSKDLSVPISKKRDSLQSYVRSFEDSKKTDLLLSIQERVRVKREYTLASFDIAIAEGLLVWDAETGKLYPRAVKKQSSRGKSIKEVFKRDGKKAEILGQWFSQHDLVTIAEYLKVLF
jgi:hypothetical protein